MKIVSWLVLPFGQIWGSRLLWHVAVSPEEGVTFVHQEQERWRWIAGSGERLAASTGSPKKVASWMNVACYFFGETQWPNCPHKLTFFSSHIKQRNGEKLWFRPSRCKELVSVDKSRWIEGWPHNIPQSHMNVSQYSCYGGMTDINHQLTVW